MRDPAREAAGYWNQREEYADAAHAWAMKNRDTALEILVAIKRLENDYDKTFDSELDDICNWDEVFGITSKEVTEESGK